MSVFISLSYFVTENHWSSHARARPCHLAAVISMSGHGFQYCQEGSGKVWLTNQLLLKIQSVFACLLQGELLRVQQLILSILQIFEFLFSLAMFNLSLLDCITGCGGCTPRVHQYSFFPSFLSQSC